MSSLEPKGWPKGGLKSKAEIELDELSNLAQLMVPNASRKVLLPVTVPEHGLMLTFYDADARECFEKWFATEGVRLWVNHVIELAKKARENK